MRGFRYNTGVIRTEYGTSFGDYDIIKALLSNNSTADYMVKQAGNLLSDGIKKGGG